MPKETKCKICGLPYTMSKHPDICAVCAKKTKPSWWPENPYKISKCSCGCSTFNKDQHRIWQEASDACARAVIKELNGLIKHHTPIFTHEDGVAFADEIIDLISQLKEKP
jgi:hypothetical protein